MKKIAIIFIFFAALYQTQSICMQHTLKDYRLELIHAINKDNCDYIEQLLREHHSLANAYGPCITAYSYHTHSYEKVAPLHYVLCKAAEDEVYKSLSLKHMHLLLRAGADPNATDASYMLRRAPLHMAESLTIEHIQLLLRYGADVNQADGLDRTPLMMYVQANKLDLVRYILEHAHVEINQRGYNLQTALHYAADKESTQIIDLLLSHGADHTLHDGLCGRTPLTGAWNRLYKWNLFSWNGAHDNWFSFYLLIACDAYLLKKFVEKEQRGKYCSNLCIAEQKLQYAIGVTDIEKLCNKHTVEFVYQIAGKSIVREELITAIDRYDFKAVKMLIRENPYVVNAYGECPRDGDKITPLQHIQRIPIKSECHNRLISKHECILMKAGAKISAVPYDDRPEPSEERYFTGMSHMSSVD